VVLHILSLELEVLNAGYYRFLISSIQYFIPFLQMNQSFQIMSTNRWTALVMILIVGFVSCQDDKNVLFKKVSSSHSGIDFNNKITDTDSLNILNFHYIYNGGGVGVGDFNKDGLPDLVFSGNQVPSKIYLNKGGLNFQDITDLAHFNTKGWATGVSIIDINGDGWQDVYISIGGYECDSNCNNQLFLHQGLDVNGLPLFKEVAAEYGLSDGLYTQQAAFFDYDLDGDLDVYLLHNVIDQRDKNVPSEKRFINKKSIDQLLENDGNGHFTDVSEAMGITARGYGLGITINDFNNDHLPDLYIANDFLSDDLLYLNKGFENKEHLGFEEASKKYLKHTSYNAMGVDVADVNNDNLPDIMVLDMLPEYNERQKTMLGFMNYNKFLLTLRQGYSPQFIRNTLQIHNGFLNNEMLPFSEVGYMAGIYNTDWSWTPLLADFDNDGDRDLYVTNGYGKDITDLDFINYSQQRSPFGTKETQEKELYEAVRAMKSITMPNYIFENEGNLQFKNRSKEWIKKENSISNGAVYADLDNDGDLDIIVNNIDAPALVLENQTAAKENNNFLKVQLKGTTQNPSGIGSKVVVWTKGKAQIHYQSPVRGYLSSVEDVCHFGLGKHKNIDSLVIIWFNGQVKTLRNIEGNQLVKVDISTAKRALVNYQQQPALLFSEAQIFENYEHQENQFQDFDRQPLLLHQHSKQGPCLATANIDDKAGDELFVGGAKGVAGQIFYKKENGTYTSQLLSDAAFEDTDAAFFDYDLDGDLDLYVVSGGTEFGKETDFKDRIYINDGQGNLSTMVFSPAQSSGGCVIANDFDKDGDIDLFVGGRVVPRQYPLAPKSYLLVNEKGKLIDKTDEIAPQLRNVGMITDAVWSDYDKDGWVDLIAVGEWMPITIFKNKKGAFQEEAIKIDNSKGFWNSIVTGDFDEDGDEDYLLGNLGKNTRLKASEKMPLLIYNSDFDKNGSPDPLIGQSYLNKKGEQKVYPLHTRDDVIKQLPQIKNRYLLYADFGKITFSELLESDLTSNDFKSINRLTSCYLQNKGNGIFELNALPQEAQIAPIQDILVADFNKDGHLDALLSGNNYTGEKNNGWQDAFNGLLLQGNGNGDFERIRVDKSGFYVPKDGRDIVKMKDENGQSIIVVGQNSDKLRVFKW
jgi:hypothetical protein